MRKTLFIYGGLLLIAIILVRIFEYYYLQRNIGGGLYWGVSGAVVLLLGAWIGKEFLKPSRQSEAQDSKFAPDAELLGLSKREMEVLSMIEQGMSNQRIADELFLSLSTVKTHTSNIYTKLGVKNRVQALAKARELNSGTGT